MWTHTSSTFRQAHVQARARMHTHKHTPTHRAISGAKTDISLLLTSFPTRRGDVSSPLSHCQAVKRRQRKMDRQDERKIKRGTKSGRGKTAQTCFFTHNILEGVEKKWQARQHSEFSWGLFHISDVALGRGDETVGPTESRHRPEPSGKVLLCYFAVLLCR